MSTKHINISLSIIIGLAVLIACISSTNNDKNITDNTIITPTKRSVQQKIKNYWYDGKSEISSYQLTQARYGELHEGTAVLVYVTEPFSKTSNTKADRDNKSNIPVLKLNKTFKFNTGIYPYSMMNSTFFPLENGDASLKIASSLQEWCGMTYLEMKNKNQFIFNFNSYFEGYSFKDKKIKHTLLEDDLWSLIRLNPEFLPIGKQSIIPSMFFLRLRGKEPKIYQANLSLEKDAENITNYTIEYPELERKLTIKYSSNFPYKIMGWEDTHYSGYGNEKKLQTSTAILLENIKTDY